MGVVWVWLAALNDCFGICERVLSEREMRAHDQTAGSATDRYAIALGDWTGGKQHVHYPDLVVVTTEGSRVAVELELTLKSRRRSGHVVT